MRIPAYGVEVKARMTAPIYSAKSCDRDVRTINRGMTIRFACRTRSERLFVRQDEDEPGFHE